MKPRIECEAGFSELPFSKRCAEVLRYALRLTRIKLTLNPGSRQTIRCKPNAPL